MTSAGKTPPIPTSSAKELRLAPVLERDPAEPVDTSPLWPLVLLLAEIAARVEGESGPVQQEDEGDANAA